MSRRFFMGSIPPVLHPSSAVLRAARRANRGQVITTFIIGGERVEAPGRLSFREKVAVGVELRAKRGGK